ncbi:hypothetical protein J7T55_001650 [Diaporthe amygdali]|uniref:uncharacterized protein n=1 Tax=Phomopsis amygdali TaxID=1214568 RepID=UPI0022FF41FE|nr:uncharacterized protein J7T55_001650 [Diaporthe amygdali]KAJ0115240.1 hypothetical protein J7T55_001650 [Diaporthe amygdali]
MTTATVTPTLPASWEPTVAGCLSTSDFWQWDYGPAKDKRTVLGGPSQTTNCLPTAWASDIVYSGSECPPNYTSACQGTDTLSAVTCCPSLYRFTCVYPVSSLYHGSQFRCMSAWATSKAVRVTHTNFVENNLAVETQTAQPNLHVFALAIIYVTSFTWQSSESSATSVEGSNDLTAISSQTDISSSSSSSTAQSASRDSSSDTGISTGASAGIGIRAAVVVAFLAFVAWWMYRRRRFPRQVSELGTDHSPYTPEMADEGNGLLSNSVLKLEAVGAASATWDLVLLSLDMLISVGFLKEQHRFLRRRQRKTNRRKRLLPA